MAVHQLVVIVKAPQTFSWMININQTCTNQRISNPSPMGLQRVSKTRLQRESIVFPERLHSNAPPACLQRISKAFPLCLQRVSNATPTRLQHVSNVFPTRSHCVFNASPMRPIVFPVRLQCILMGHQRVTNVSPTCRKCVSNTS